MNTQILVATQKKIKFNINSCYYPIFVGADLHDTAESLDYLLDNTGDNISAKNKTFCELTALYWLWKNSHADIVGLNHYRRFLSEKRFTKDPKYVLGQERIETILENYDIILPKESLLWGTVRQQYSTGQYDKDYILCGDILKERYPEYYNDFLTISNSDSIFICNMFVSKKALCNQYCSWLFDILFELENKVDISTYTASEKRIFGYLSERLFNVWILHNRPTIYRCNLLNTETTLKKEFMRIFHTFNYKVLGIDVLKYAARRKAKRDGKR